MAPLGIEVVFKRLIARLKTIPVRFAVAGGLAISIYRAEKRTTEDVDILLFAEGDSKQQAQTLIKEYKLQPRVVQQADLEGGPLFARKKRSSPAAIIVGRDSQDTQAVGIDFILPTMPWFRDALERAQSNAIDFGFGPVPTMTVEDLILAKCYALAHRPDRFKDLDDLQSVFRSKNSLDLVYLTGQMIKLGLQIPRGVIADAPAVLVRLTRGRRSP